MSLFHGIEIYCRLCEKPQTKMSLGVNALGELRVEIYCEDCQTSTDHIYVYNDLIRCCRTAEINDAEVIDLAEIVLRGPVM